MALRGRANAMGWTLNEYALTTLKGGKVVAGKSEAEIYAKLKLAYIEPELREMTGEIEAAEEGKLPDLIELKDMRGDLHMHTTASDGRATPIEEMGDGRARLGATNTSPSPTTLKAVTVANGLDEKRTLEQIPHDSRRRGNGFPGIRLPRGNREVDIRKDGTLDLDNEVLCPARCRGRFRALLREISSARR